MSWELRGFDLEYFLIWLAQIYPERKIWAASSLLDLLKRKKK